MALLRFRRAGGATCAVWAAVAALLVIAAGAAGRARAAEAYSEDAVKAAYLYRFAGYVAWPAGAQSASTAATPFIIVVLDAPGVARALRDLLPDHPFNHRAAEVREVSGVENLGTPQILYAGPGRASSMRALISAQPVPPVLIVTDEAGGLAHGGIINFLSIDSRVRFEVSLVGARAAGLRISSELLGVAVRVIGAPRELG